MRALLLVNLCLVAVCCNKKEPAEPAEPAPIAVPPAHVAAARATLEIDGDVDAALDVMRRRVAALQERGLLPRGEPDIRRSGGSQITVQLPFEAEECDREKLTVWDDTLARSLTRSGRLGFYRADEPRAPGFGELERAVRSLPGITSVKVSHLGSLELLGRTAEQLMAGQSALPAPPGKRVRVQDAPAYLEDASAVLWLLDEKPELTGEHIQNASAEIDGQTGQPRVSLVFTKDGGERFATVSGELVGKVIAIVFEGTVRTAPVVREAITGGKAVIDLGTAASPDDRLREAHELAAVLLAGPMHQKVRVLSRSITCE